MKRSRWYLAVFVTVMFLLGFITIQLFLKDPQGSQRSLLFFDQDDYFMDFFNTLNYTAGRDPYNVGYGGLVNRNYLPLAYLILHPFSKLGDYVNFLPKELRFEQASMIGCVIFIMISFGAFFYFLYEGKTGKRIEKLLTVMACACSGLVIYNIDRANTVILAVAALMMYLLFYRDEKWYYRHLALLALGISAALKVYPAIFGILLIYEKRWKDTFFAVIYGASWVFLPFLYFKEGFGGISLLLYNVSLNSKKYYGGTYSLVTNHILDTSNFMTEGFLIANIVLLFVLGIAWVQQKRWKQILLLMCGLLLTPTHSGYYCGLYMFIPLIFFLNEEEHTTIDWLYLALFILIINPYQFSFQIQEMPFLRNKIDNFMISNMAAILIYLILIVESIIKLTQYALLDRKNVKSPANRHVR